jgi:hypothetical protein
MRRTTLFILLGLGLLIPASPAFAIPAFARRYGVECIFCHDGFPKLNVVGQRFKERGFRLDKEDAFDVNRWLKSVPIVLRGEGNRTFVQGSDGFNAGFLKVISAGNLGKKVSYWVDDAEAISSGDTSNTKPDNAWLRYEILDDDHLYVKGGRFELDIPFTQVRTPHLFPYEIYAGNTGFESESIGVHKDGAEVGGETPGDVHWSAALVQGHSQSATGGDAGFNPNVFLRAAKRWDRNRVGIFSYFGSSTLSFPPNLQWTDHQVRVGADLSVWIDRLNLYGVYMVGHNDNSVATLTSPSGTGVGASFNGGFIQADYSPKDPVCLTLRLNVVNEPLGTTGPAITYSSLFPGIQIFIFEHGKVSFEYGFQNQGQKGVGEVQAEFAF